ncbi:MAG: serine protease [Clostridia bacterium]|nr:serine protease [Clostridia bacterium]
MKKFRILLLVLIILPCISLFGGCSWFETKYVVNIIETADNIYTVKYSDGSTSIIDANGEDGEDLTLESIEEYCNSHGLNFYDFLAEHFGIDSLISSATVKATKSAVSIISEFSKISDTSVAGGAGVIYKMNNDYSYVITNYHVVYYRESTTPNKIASRIHLFQYGTQQSYYKNGNSIEYGENAVACQYIGGSLNYDIAILRVPTATLLNNNPEAKPVSISNGYQLAETAIAIGNPNVEGLSVTSGIISVISEEINMKGADEMTNCDFRVLRIDTAINGGNSGGGLFNQYGELIGIVNAKYIDEEIDNIAYALPYDNITKVADNLIHYFETTGQTSRVKKLYCDISVSPENSKAEYIDDTVKITDQCVVKSVTDNKAGDKLGLEVEDIILSLTITRGTDTTTLTFDREYEFREAMLTIRAGDSVSVKVNRSGTIVDNPAYTILNSDLKMVD